MGHDLSSLSGSWVLQAQEGELKGHELCLLPLENWLLLLPFYLSLKTKTLSQTVLACIM